VVTICETLTIDTIHSPDDGGYYAEAYDPHGKEKYSSHICSTREQARVNVRRWAAVSDYGWRNGKDF
jgi:hypothetical protein